MNGKPMLMASRSLGMDNGMGGCTCRWCHPMSGEPRAQRLMFRRMVKRRERQVWKRDVAKGES